MNLHLIITKVVKMHGNFRTREKLELGKLATFVPNKSLPIYNWFYYKEGFARDFVFEIASEFNLSNGNKVLDPFCGSGTTNLACKDMGIDSYGFDVLPISVFVSRVKTGNYDLEKLKSEAKIIMGEKPKSYGGSYGHVSELLRKSFAGFTLSDILFYRERLSHVDDKAAREFLFLALMDSAMKCSLFVKDGACLKKAKRHIPPLREIFRRRVSIMIKDLEKFETKPCKTLIDYGDARKIELPDESIDAIITSPPYLNKIEYTNIYRIEEDLFFGKERLGIRSFVGADEKRLLEKEFDEIDFSIPLSAKPYFFDTNLAIKEFYRVCKPKARTALVVGDGFIENQVVDSCALLSILAERAGFKVNEIIVINKRIATTPSRHRVGELKESLLLWTKE